MSYNMCLGGDHDPMQLRKHEEHESTAPVPVPVWYRLTMCDDVQDTDIFPVYSSFQST